MSYIPTFNDLPEDIRHEMAAFLNQCLADSHDLYTHAKQAHWNVRGADFLPIHELFDRIAQHALNYGDEFAERAGQLGSSVRGTLRMSAAATSLPEYEAEIDDTETHIRALARSFSSYTRRLRPGITRADEAGDAITADLLTEAVRASDKLLWFLESHLAAGTAKPMPKAPAKVA